MGMMLFTCLIYRENAHCHGSFSCSGGHLPNRGNMKVLE